jgi:long-chain acyl-CoA synthetase
MYTAQPPKDRAYILKDCGAKVVIAADGGIHRQLKSIAGELPDLRHLLGIDLPETDPESFRAHLSQGARNASPVVHPKARDLAGYVYTSGTTGNPKAAKLSHGNICSNVSEFEPIFRIGRARSLAFLPWAHSYGQTSELHFLVGNGGSIAINDKVPNLVKNLVEVKPTLLVAVPRIFNRIYDTVNKQMATRPSPIRMLFKAGIRNARRRANGEKLGVLDRALLALAERLIFSRVRAKFGGRLALVISGSAALGKAVAEFIDALGIVVYEGYGLTETSPVAATNRPGHRKIGTVGRAIPGVTITIDEAQSDEPGEGEVIVFGPNVMQGYHNLPEETAAVLIDGGGFRTGDLGRLDSEGYLTITGRLKEQYKLENGKYVSPAMLEEQMKLSPFVSNVMLYGANKPYNVALVVPDAEALSEWARKNGVPLDSGHNDERVDRLLLSELVKHSDCRGYERPRKVGVVPDDFTPENGMLTPSLKIKRPKVVEKYQKLIDGLY